MLMALRLSLLLLAVVLVLGGHCFTTTEQLLSMCKSREIVSFVNSSSSYYHQHGEEHSPFKLALHKLECAQSLDFSSPADCEYQVEISANDPSTHIIGFVLQVVHSAGLATSRFVFDKATADTNSDEWKITSCAHEEDTIVKSVSAPQQAISATLIATAASSISFRYFIVDNNFGIHADMVKANIHFPTLSSYKSEESERTHLRRKRAVSDNPSAQLLVANGDYLHLSSLDGSRVQTPVLVNQSSDNILAVDYNYRQGFIYWTDNTGGRIMRSSIDGSMIVSVLEQGLNEPDGISVDWVTNKIYFTDTGLEIVGVFDVENNWYKVLLSTLVGTTVSQPRAIVVDPTTGWMYWTDWGDNARVEKASMDGRNRTVLHNTGLTWPNGLTIDYDRQTLYWVDALVDVLQSSNVDGTNRITLADRTRGLSHPFGVSFFNNTIFACDWNGNKVQAFPLSSDSTTLVFDRTCAIPYGLVVMSEQRQRELTNPCTSSGCSHLCLLSAIDSQGYTCDCPEGYTMSMDQLTCTQDSSCVSAGFSTCCMSGDCTGTPSTCYCDANCHRFGDCCSDVSSTCLSTEADPYIVYTSDHYIYQVSFPRDQSDSEVRHRSVLSGLSRAADIDFHFSNGHLYWTDTIERKIWRSNFDGTGVLTILDTGTSPPTEIAIDWVTGNLYWVNGSDSTINIFDASSGNQVSLVIVVGTITDLALDPMRREMYWTVSGGTPMIEKSSMDGNNRAILQSSNLGVPSSLSIDFTQQVVVWADTQQDRVERSNFDGSGRATVYSGSDLPTIPGLSSPLDPNSIALYEGALYYVGLFVGIATTSGNSSRRILNYNLGCTDGGSVQIISSTRQPQATNPCSVNNGGCSNDQICVLSSTVTMGRSCLSSETIGPTLPPPGSCVAAGITGCCESGSCMGSPPTCSCASNCQLFRDCCSDFNCNVEPTASVVTVETPSTEPVTTPSLPTPLEFTMRPESVSVNESEQATFQCTVNVPTALISWHYTQQGTSVGMSISGQSEDFSVQSGSGSSTLTVLSAAFPQHDGEYTCTATNMGGPIVASAYLNVLVIPTSTISSDSSPSELEDIAILCTVRANPSPEITWLKSSPNEVTRILTSSRISFQSRVTPERSVESTLQITRVTAADSGTYVCQVDNDLTTSPVGAEWTLNVTIVDACLDQTCLNGGTCVDLENGYSCVCVGNFEGENCETPVNVPVGPTITVHPSNATVSIASSINLNCMATGVPTPSYSWYKDGELIEGETESSLNIPEAQPEHRGVYTCEAKNVEGVATSSQAFISIPGVLQYSMQVQLSSNTDPDSIREVTLSLASSELSNTDTSVFSVNVLNLTQSGGSVEVTLLITLLPSQEEPSPEQIVRIREALVSELRQAPTITSTDNLIRVDGCESEEYQGVAWPETSLGSSAAGPCPCLNIIGESAGRGNRFCGGTYTQGAVWSSEVDLTSCFTSQSAVSQQLCDIALLLGKSPNVTAQVSRDIVNITAQSQELSSNDVSTAAVVVEQLASEAATNIEVTENYLQTIDNIQQADANVILASQMEANSSARILDSLDTFLDNLVLDIVNSTNNQTTLRFDTFAVQIQEIDPNDFNGQTFIVVLGSVEQAMNRSGDISQDSLRTIDGNGSQESQSRRRRLAQEDVQNSTAYVQIPSSILDECVSSNVSDLSSTTASQRLSYSVFARTVLFQPENTSISAVGSIVLAARIRCELANKTRLSVPIRSSFLTNEPERAIDSYCAAYSTQSEGRFGAWDTSRCRKIDRGDGRIDCDCSQLGHFGILFDLGPNPPRMEFAIVLSVLTYIGLGISLICLTIFILTDLICKKLRSNTHNQVLINMAISLMCLYILFLIGGFTTGVPPLCGIVSALLHYFFLVFFSWTAVEAVWLYIKLVKVIGSQSLTTRFMLKAGLPAWLIPVVIVIISGGAGYQYYTSAFYCRPTEWPFYFGYILPFLVVYLFDFVMFIFIMTSICKHTRNMNVTKEKTPAEKVQDLKKNFYIAMSLAVVLGLGWGFGLVATSSDIEELTFVFQVIFSIFVGSQGFLIFILHGVRNADFRDFWTKLLRIQKLQIQPATKYTVANSEKANMTIRNTGSGSGTDSVAFSSRSSAPEKIDLAMESTSEVVTTCMNSNSYIQSPTDSVFSPEGEMCSELLPDTKLEMKPNECYQTVQTGRLADVKPSDIKPNECYETVLSSNTTGGASRNDPPQYEEIQPRVGGMD